jgi:D-alanine-D-alanine ligase
MRYREPKICILGGGWSNERLISLKSSNDVYNCLKQNGHDVIFYDMSVDSFENLKKVVRDHSIDLVFNLIHGEGGEDGTVQKYLDKLSVEYCGSDAKSSKISFNKYDTKIIWEQNGFIIPKYEIYESQDYNYCYKEYGDHFFIKDTCSGSSNNIFLISNSNEFSYFLNNYDKKRQFIIEEKISADEYTAAILHNQLLPIIKIKPGNDFYDYDAKYASNLTEFTFPKINNELAASINNTILNAFNIIGCDTWGRVDFFIKADEIILLELNTIPGMTDHSLVPKAAIKDGIDYYQLILNILDLCPE